MPKKMIQELPSKKQVQKTQKKTKPIKKDKNKKESSEEDESYGVDNYSSRTGSQNKANRNLSGVKLGPSYKKNRLEHKEKLTAKIEKPIMQYLYNIGLTHMLFFKQKQIRQALIKQGKGQWNQEDKWDREDQLASIKNNTKIQDNFNQMRKKNENLNEDLIIDLLYSIGESLSSSECSIQIYKLISEVLLSIVYGEQEEDRAKRAQKLFGEFEYFNGKFTNIRHKYYLNITGDESNIKNHFVEMFKQLWLSLKSIWPSKLKDLQNQMSYEKKKIEDLQKIKSINSKK